MMLRMPILAVVLLLALTSLVRAQTPCGIVAVDGPTEVTPGTALVFNATHRCQSHDERRNQMEVIKIHKASSPDVEEAALDLFVLVEFNQRKLLQTLF